MFISACSQNLIEVSLAFPSPNKQTQSPACGAASGDHWPDTMYWALKIRIGGLGAYLNIIFYRCARTI